MSGYTQEQLDGLRAAVARGVKVIKGPDGEVTYGSLDEMLRLIAVIERSLATTATVRQHYPTFSRGT